jgi:hypothetical protein
MSIDDVEEEHELSLTVGNINKDEIESINKSLKDMGLTLNDPNIWIGDTGATTYNTAYVINSINNCEATELDNIVGGNRRARKSKDNR